ncbi:MAG: PilZ domain-containing protein [Candidatus Eremiobacteraeota bacterium]|nr:PilZ domain-containing protein [Candidatus Eremiobacteraeota bacterium]
MIFRKIFGSAPKKTIDTDRLPRLRDFVDVAVMGRPVESVSVESIDDTEICTGALPAGPGEPAMFVYATPSGRFRFATKVLSTQGGIVRFKLPASIEEVAGSQKRSARMHTLVPTQWRFAPGRKGVGEFLKGSVRDIGLGGCALIVERQFKLGQLLEVKLPLQPGAPPLQVLAEVTRSEQIPTSGKFSHGLRLLETTSAQERAIEYFMNRKQSELRARGLA